MMTPERWQKVRGVLEQALELAPEEQPRFLDVACSSDPSLRSEVESLLSSDKNARPGFLQTPGLRPPELTPSTKLGDYEIISQLGSGGMGVVYRARDLRLGRVVAIKVLPAHFSSDANRLKRFEQEAKAAAALNHPNILAVYQLGSYEGVPYLVSELLEGDTLREELKHGALPQQQVMDYGEQIADGLNTAHERGIIHRDLKPENLFVTKEHRVKILDFGLAKLLLEKGSAEKLETLEALELQTHPGTMAGTVGYMSPEQVRGEKLDARTDLFSFAVVLYEMVTGKRPFVGNTSGVTFDAILNRQPTPVSQLNSEVAPGLETIINKALEKDREVRYQHASEIRADLKRLKLDTESRRTVSHVPPAPKISRTIYWIGSIAVLVLLASAIFLYKRPSSRLEAKKQMVLRDLTANSIDNPVDSAVISPDGTQLALADRASRVSLLQIATGDTRVLYKGSNVSVLSWYPDGAHLLATGDNWDGLWKVSAFDGKKQRLLAEPKLSAAALSPDGKWIAFVAEATRKIWIMGSSGENPVQLTNPSDAQVYGLAWSPTSRRILYRLVAVGKSAIASCDREGGHEIQIVSSPDLGNNLGATDVYWGSDGRVFYTLRESPPNERDSNIWAVAVDSDTGKVTGESSRVTSFSGLTESYFSQPKNGKELIFCKTRRKDAILIADVNPVSGELRKVTPLRSEGWNVDVPVWTHDGRKLVFYSNPRGEPGIYIQDLQTQEIQALATGVAPDSHAALTFDGKWLLFTQVHGQPSGNYFLELLRMPLDGGPATPLLTGNFMFQCAPKAPLCVLCDVNTKQQSFFQLDPIHGRGARLAHAESLDLDPVQVDWSVSPDGKNIAYLPEHNGNQIGILSTETKGSRTITVDGGQLQSPAWAADGEHFYVVSRQQAKWNLLYVEPSGKYKTAMTSPPDVWISYPRPSPDGRRLAFQQRSWESNYAMLENY
jgi:eukaryotic-like serine/threonine-protein kinase